MQLDKQYKKNSQDTFLIEINDHVLQQIENSEPVFVQEGKSSKDMQYYAFLVTQQKTFEIYKKELTNQILVCSKIEDDTQIYSMQDKVLQIKEVQPSFKQIMMYLQSLKLEDFKKNELPTLDYICQQFVISKPQLIEFLQQKNIFTQDEVVYFLNEEQLFSIFIDFLCSIKVITKSFDQIQTNTTDYNKVYDEFKSKYGEKITQFIIHYFFTKTDDDNLRLDFDTVLSILVFDVLNKSNEFYYVEFISVINDALKLCYPIQQYLEYIKPKLNTNEYIIQIQNLIKQRGIIKDYNAYDTQDDCLWSEENIKMLVNNYRDVSQVKERLELLKIHKDTFSREELNIYFQDLYQKQNQFESFIKKGFQRIFEDVHVKKLERFQQYHPNLSRHISDGLNKYQKSVMLYKIKTIWL